MKQIEFAFAVILAMLVSGSFVFGQQDTTLTIDNNGYVGIGTVRPIGQWLIYEKSRLDCFFLFVSGFRASRVNLLL